MNGVTKFLGLGGTDHTVPYWTAILRGAVQGKDQRQPQATLI
ncbi:MAG: hypothetical protein QOI53_2170 [Verrucomicrobiota bacterium]|nr:hypothetical protein [Verrucomicrobiota bacterium]